MSYDEPKAAHVLHGKITKNTNLGFPYETSVFEADPEKM